MRRAGARSERPPPRGGVSFRDFVDDALFHPEWGYYATGKVRFGDGGDYDTFPDAVSPLFGEAVALQAWRSWQREGRPPEFVLVELGAGNGQMCLDVWGAIQQRARRRPPWRRFESALRYIIFERSPALVRRQQSMLRASGAPVEWRRVDLSVRRAPRLAEHGFLVANEVLDCLAHHALAPLDDGSVGVIFVDAMPGAAPRMTAPESVPVSDQQAKARWAGWRERVEPLASVRGLRGYLRRCVPALLGNGRWRAPYFVCPSFEPLMRHTAALFDRGEALWIDYGDERAFHWRATAARKVFAGTPGSGRSVYERPGHDDITFFVDFTAAARAAVEAGWRVDRLVSQSEWFAESGIALGPAAVERILAQRAVRWLSALLGVDPERDWRAGALTFRAGGRRARLRTEVERAVAELAGRRPSPFRALVLRRG